MIKKQEIKPLDKQTLASNGSCCGLKCKNCPFTPRWVKGSSKIIR